MKIRNVTLCLVILLWLNGCVYITPSYEVFAGNMDNRVKYWKPNKYNKNTRQIYDEHRYIYVYENDPKGCIRGILTNRDDKPEKAIGWIILSGKENCKETSSFVLLQ
jgi:hypothetical protein